MLAIRRRNQAVLVELPVFIAIAAKPLAAVVMPFVGKAHGYPILAKRPQFLDQPVFEFRVPICGSRNCLDGLAALEKFGAVAPPAVRRVGESDARRIAGIPRIFSHARLLCGCLQRKRR